MDTNTIIGLRIKNLRTNKSLKYLGENTRSLHRPLSDWNVE